MMKKEIEMNPNRLVAILGKQHTEFTMEDIVKYIREEGIRMVNFMYPASDGRLKTLNFVINDLAYLEAILTCGERVDGQASSRSSRPAAAIYTLYRVSEQHSSTLSPKFPR